MTPTEFKALLKDKDYRFEVEGETIKVMHWGHVHLPSLTTLPEGVTFKNGGGVGLAILTTLPEGVTFENTGAVYLPSITTTSEGVTFDNGGYVYLPSLKTLPKGVTFQNRGDVYLPSLNGHHVYHGAMRQFRNVDGRTMLITSTKQRGDYRVHRAKYFGGGDIERLASCYVAESKGLYAHGKTAKQAIEDLQFKFEKSAGKSQIIEQVKNTRIVTLSQFRSITGACREGVRHHLSQHDIDLDSINSMSLTEALNLMQGTSYGEEFAAHFEGASA